MSRSLRHPLGSGRHALVGMTCTRSTKYGRIALWGCFRSRDEVDAMLASALLGELRRRQPDACIIAFSPDPVETQARHGIEACAPPATRGAGLARALFGRGFGLGDGSSLAALADVDVLIVTGSEALREGDDSLTKLRALCQRSGTRLDLLPTCEPGESAGITDPLFAAELCPTLAEVSGRPVIGVNPGDTSLARLVDLVAWLLLERYPVRLVASCPGERELCAELEARLHAEGVLDPARSLIEAGGCTDAVDVLRGCQLVVAAHPRCMLIAALLRIPVLGLCEGPDSRRLLETLGQGRHALDSDGLGTPRLVDEFCFLRASAETARDRLSTRIPECRKALFEQLDRLYGPVVAA